MRVMTLRTAPPRTTSEVSSDQQGQFVDELATENARVDAAKDYMPRLLIHFVTSRVCLLFSHCLFQLN